MSTTYAIIFGLILTGQQSFKALYKKLKRHHYFPFKRLVIGSEGATFELLKQQGEF